MDRNLPKGVPMGTYAITGSASGMGAATAARLRADGHTVIGVDIRDADVVADLSTAQGRTRAADAVLTACGGRLDGAVLAAGLGPSSGAERVRLIATVNYLGVAELLGRWRPALAAANSAKVVVVGSNSTTGAGIRLNVLAPGAVMTPLLQEQLANPRQARMVERFPVPVGGYGDPEHLSEWMCFMLSDAADFLCGSVVFVDGGTDALFRGDDWPRSYPARRLIRYVRRFRARS